MQNNKVKKLFLIRRLLKNQLDAAAMGYSTSAKMLRAELLKQQQLEEYNKNYHSDMFKTNNGVTSINTIKQKAIFISHIESILVTQKVLLAKLQRDSEDKRALWLHLRNKFNKLSEYIENIETELFDVREVSEQKELDTLVNDLYAHNKNIDA